MPLLVLFVTLIPACGALIGDASTQLTHDDAAAPRDDGDSGGLADGSGLADSRDNGGGCRAACTQDEVSCEGTSNVRRCEVGVDGCARWATIAVCASGTLCCGGACVAADAKHCFACDATCSGATPVCSASLSRCACTNETCSAAGSTCDEGTGACIACRTLKAAPLDGYDGSSGISVAQANALGAKVGLLRWRTSFGPSITDPGDVAGLPWCSGVLIGAASFLTAAHCLESGTDRGLRWPRPAAGVDLRPVDAARAMRVQFEKGTAPGNTGVRDAGTSDAGMSDAGLGDASMGDASMGDAGIVDAGASDAEGGAPSDDVYDVLDLIEIRSGGFDYAILRLGGAPASAHGYADVGATLDQVGQTTIAGFLANDHLAVTAPAPMATLGNQLRYDGLGSARTADGSPIFDAATGLLVGLHLTSTCTQDPLGSFGLALSAARGSSPILRSLVVGRRDDLDGDGSPDMIVQTPSTGALDAWMIDGTRDQTRRAVRPLSEGLSSDWIVGPRADFDGDGHLDLVVQNPTTGEVRALFLGGSDGTTVLRHRAFSWTVAGVDWLMRGVADFDNDGHADILWYQKSTGRAHAWILRGPDGIVVDHDLAIGGTMDAGAWELGGAGDFNRDGVDDLMWMRLSDGAVVVWSLGGSTRNGIMTQSVATWTAGPQRTWHPYRVTDVDEDGHVDILWRDDVKGSLGPWYMIGTEGLDVEYNGFVDVSLDVTTGVFVAN